MQLPIMTAPHLCNATLLENEVILIEWHEVSRAAVDAHYQMLDELYATGSTTLRMIHCPTTKSMPPLNYLIVKGKQLRERYPSRTTRTYTAILYPRGIIITLLDRLLNALLNGTTEKVRFFEQDQQQQAVEWLLSLE